ncbi:methyl-accepting chemotaxis protein [Pandoraea anhela]|uniref:Membrane protein n=1 Tax=Pandoraea anhela TaxID=2508295 RepID=A0A5E4ZA40_9BURK|nr:methyl-accepting chemotaxis protein [Pandoraea anhela]VVE57013.1 membrane protein [Pandoraea anhela]
MNRLTLKQKLWVPMLLCWVALLIVTVVNALDARRAQMATRRADLANVTDMAMSIIADYAKQVSDGKLSLEDAKQQAIARVNAQRYGADGYISIVRGDSVMVNHPMSPKLNGKDMSGFRDAKGNALYHDIAQAGSSSSGAGYLRYWWPKPGETTPSEKIGYVKRFTPWNWDLIAGAYMDDIEAQFYATLMRSAAILVVLGLLVSLVASRVVRSVSRSIGGEPSNAAEIAKQIAQGNLATPIDVRRDDTASLLFSLREMRDQLAVTVGRIQSSAETITVASKEISAGNLDLSSRTEEQAASLEQTAATMDEITKTVTQNADSATTASELAADASRIAERGGQVVNDVVEKMAGITDSSRKIGEIINVIEGIAFQTNILALNAAVEAARAGEEGRGFAVVAGEVRNLAQRSATAAKEIKVLIDQSVEQVVEGSALAGRAGSTIGEVVDAVRRVTAIVNEISAASREQSTSIGEVNLAIRQMDDVTQRNAALVEQAAAVAGSLDEQTEWLRGAVAVFRIQAHA